MRFLLFFCCLLWALPAPADLALDLECLNEAYPGLIAGTERDAAGRVWLRTSAGERLLYDDGAARTHGTALGDADIEDAMRQLYPLEPERPDPAPDEEPGRLRSYPLLRALYGPDRHAVEKNLERAALGGTPVRLSAPAAAALRRIEAALPSLRAQTPLDGYFSPVYGYFWRTIAGTGRLSAHAFGIAVDVNPDKGPYWRWSKARPHPLQKTFPSGLVALFEEHGFIWGGKWDHYDLMHFEYRPELIIKARKLRARAAEEAPALRPASPGTGQPAIPAAAPAQGKTTP